MSGHIEIMGPEYGQAGHRWSGDDRSISELYEREHTFTRSGDIQGPMGPIPHPLGIKYQSIHNQLVWRNRNRMAQDAVRSMEGAAGLLSSYRAGGGAALESGIYAQKAGLQMQQADMMQPMDLMGDYRRHQQAKAAGGGGDKWASIGGSVLSTIGTGVSMAGFPMVGVPMMAAGAGLQAYGAGSGGGYSPQPTQQGWGRTMEAGAGPGGAGPGGAAPGFIGPPRGPGSPVGGPPGVYPPSPPSIGPPAMGAQLGGDSPGPQVPVPRRAPGVPGEDGPPAAGPASEIGPSGGYLATGAGDGLMMPGARVARRFAQTPFGRELDTVLAEALVDEITNDPTYSMLTSGFDIEIQKRLESNYGPARAA